MTKKILIDASHAEETRVVVLDGSRLEDFDVETATRRQIKGNIYLAKVIRVEPSLQAAFVEYGGNRHGFLAFGEIHPDYYQIPVADRQRLLALQAQDEAEPDESLDANEQDTDVAGPAEAAQALDITPIEITESAPPPPRDAEQGDEFAGGPLVVTDEQAPAEPPADPVNEAQEPPPGDPADEPAQDQGEYDQAAQAGEPDTIETVEAAQTPPESLGGDGDDAAEARERRQRQRYLRNYKIQEVIHRRQIMLIQVVKEERGNKGAALTTYLSLAGRFSVLMPNSPTGGGVSRKITSAADRKRLKEAVAELDVPQGMGLIVRTAGANRPKPEIIRDCEYLLRLWDDIRERTMESTAPALIYEEASLIKRTIRDVYTRDVDEVLVDGAEGYEAARDFMRMLMPAHARKIRPWQDGQPLFAKFAVEAQLDAMLNPIVQLRSGGYIVINQTEALVAIDVNSGRSTRERSIEDTALRTNLEAAEEVGRQLRMRDLAGLIVIDFIDMEQRRNNAAVERRMKEALRNDRARIQLGNISHFGLMELSRQRLRPSLTEASLVLCPHCAGMGHVRSAESAALHILRAIEDEGAKFRAAEIGVYLPQEIVLYLFNHKRARLAAIEARYSMRVLFQADPAMLGSNFRIEKLKAQTATLPVAAPASYGPADHAVPEEDEAERDEDGPEAAAPDAAGPAGETAEEGEPRRRRRRRRGKRRPEADAPGNVEDDTEARQTSPQMPPEAPIEVPSEFDLVLAAELDQPADEHTAPAEPAPRRRRSRGGRRPAGGMSEPTAEAPPVPVYADIADIFEAAEQAQERLARPEAAPAEPMDTMEAAAPVPVSNGLAPAEPPPANQVLPTVIAGAAPPEKKRGWWRR